MRLIEIVHTSACDGGEGTTRAVVADDISDDEVYEALAAAQAAYRAHLAALPPAPPEAREDGWGGGPNYAKYPDLTVREVQERHAATRAAAQAYRAWRREANRGFEHFLFGDARFSRFDDLPTTEFELDWGHLHGPDPLVIVKEAS